MHPKPLRRDHKGKRLKMKKICSDIKKLSGKHQNRIDIFLLDNKWQVPAKTELHAHECVSKMARYKRGIAYLAIPWASVFDAINTGNSTETRKFIDAIFSVQSRIKHYERVFTVCQHIHFLEYGSLFALAGVTDAFCSHKRADTSVLHGVRIHAFPLYPVQFDPDTPVYGEDRKHLFSFVGCKSNEWYLSDARRHIQTELAPLDEGLIEIKDAWHYHEAVFEGAPAETTMNDKSYQKVLLDSIFCLCPSGTGPNTIRLWEALGAGCIPVVLSEQWDPPGGAELWELAVEFCDETPEAIAGLPDRLRALAADSVKLARMRARGRLIWELYGPGRFVTDILIEMGRSGTHAR